MLDKVAKKIGTSTDGNEIKVNRIGENKTKQSKLTRRGRP